MSCWGATWRWTLPPVLGVLVAAMVLTGLFVPQVIEEVIKNGVFDFAVLSPGSSPENYGQFLNNTQPDSPPGYVKFYMLNITNLAEVRKGAKPILAEVGPYTYKAYFENFDVWFSYEGAVSYKSFTYYVFDQEMSQGKENDTIITLNLPFVGALAKIKSEYTAAEWILQHVASSLESWGDGRNHGLFMERTINELLWGYRDPLLYHLTTFVKVDPEFSLMQNGSRSAAEKEHPSTMQTGIRNISLLGNFESSEGITNISWNEHVEPVRGTDGSKFPTWISDNQILTVWVGNLFRAITLVPKKTVDFFGVKLRRYMLNPKLLEPDPRFFQRIYGLLNVTSPMAGGPNGKAGQAGAPAYFSLPHYCLADPSLALGVEGIECNISKHNLFVDVEPITGRTWRVRKRLMLSSEFGPVYYAIEPHVSNTILPIFWVEEAAQASESQASKLKGSAYFGQRMVKVFKIVPCTLAVVFVTLLVWLLANTVAYIKGERSKCLIWGPDGRRTESTDKADARDVEEPLLHSPVRDGKNPPGQALNGYFRQ